MTAKEGSRPDGQGQSMQAGLVPVTFAGTLEEAELLKIFLEDEGIQAWIESEHSEVGGIPSMTRGIPVLVANTQLEAASQLIASHSHSLQDDDEDLDEDEDEDFDDEDEEDIEEDFEDDDLLDDEEDEEEDDED